MTPEDLLNQLIDERYLIQSHLNSGGMAHIFRALDTVLNRPVCLKVMAAKYLDRHDIITRFEREAQAIARLEHPHIVKIYSVGYLDSQQPYLVIEFIEGGSLRDQINHFQAEGREFTADEVVDLARSVATALARAHAEGIYHRDLKPANILIRRGQPVLADFGIAAFSGATRITQTNQKPGTPDYMSPEQGRGETIRDASSDIFSLGIIMYELLAGQRPFLPPEDDNWTEPIQFPPLEGVRPGLPAELYAIIAKCLDWQPAGRYPTATSFITALDKVPSTYVAATTTLNTPTSRDWRLWGLVAIIAVLLPLALYGLFRPDPPPATPESTATAEVVAQPLPSDTPTATATQPSPTPLVTIVTPTDAPSATPTTTTTPTTTPTATITQSPTPLVLNTPRATIPPSPEATRCPINPDSRWSTIYSIYGNRLNCATNILGTANAAYQIFENGMMIWRGDIDYVYVLPNNGAYSAWDISVADPDYYRDDLHKGGIGWLWDNFETIRLQLGDPTEAEHFADQFVVQDFSGGVLFAYLQSNGQTFILLNDSSQWTTSGG